MINLFKKCYEEKDEDLLVDLRNKIYILDECYYNEAMESILEHSYARILDAMAYCYARHCYDNKDKYGFEYKLFVESDVKIPQYEKSIGVSITDRLANKEMSVFEHENGYSIEFQDRLWYIDKDSSDIITEPLIAYGVRINRYDYYRYEPFNWKSVVLNIINSEYTNYDIDVLNCFIDEIVFATQEDFSELEGAYLVLSEYYEKLPSTECKSWIRNDLVYIDGNMYRVKLNTNYSYEYICSFTGKFAGIHAYTVKYEHFLSTRRLFINEKNMQAVFVGSTAVASSDDIYRCTMIHENSSVAFREFAL